MTIEKLFIRRCKRENPDLKGFDLINAVAYCLFDNCAYAEYYSTTPNFVMYFDINLTQFDISPEQYVDVPTHIIPFLNAIFDMWSENQYTLFVNCYTECRFSKEDPSILTVNIFRK
jgi:hypothetical protein